MQLLVEHTWPASSVHVKEQFHQTAKATFDTLGDCQLVSAEVRQLAQCNVDGDKALVWMLDHLVKVEQSRINELLGKPSFASLEIEVPASEFTQDAPLASPKRHVTIQVLREDKRFLFFNVMSNWSIFSEIPISLEDLTHQSVRPILDDPTEYIENAEEFLEKGVLALAPKENS